MIAGLSRSDGEALHELAVVAHRSRRLRRAMERVKMSALRRQGTGLAGERWRLLVRLHEQRNRLLRAWRLL